jgi:hypothetical protein
MWPEEGCRSDLQGYYLYEEEYADLVKIVWHVLNKTSNL